MAPLAQMMMARVAGKNMARIIGYAAVPVMLGPILGPVIAGAILQHASWRWLFLVNLTPSVHWQSYWRFSFCPMTVKRSGPENSISPVWLCSLPTCALPLRIGSSRRTHRPCGSAGLHGFACVLFRMAKRKGDRALIDLRLFRSRTFSASATTQFMSNGISFAGQMPDSDLSHSRWRPIAERDRLGSWLRSVWE